jgi:hypothetical protein
VASTNLRLLLDESITEPLASNIVALVPSAKLSREILGQGAKDLAVANLANRDRRTIVAVDSDFKKHVVHYGVIRIPSPDRSDDECLFAIFRMFWLSGFRGKSKNRRTSLSNDGLTIRNGEVITHKWNPKPCPHRTQA